jgi:hypothetical protein
VTTPDPGGAGLSELVIGLLRQNLEREPSRRRLLRGGTVVVAATDAEAAVRIELVPELPWEAGWPLVAPVEVRAPSVALMALAAVPLRFGLPDVASRDGRHIVAGILRRTIRVHGLVRHLATVRRLTMLLSVR